MATYKNVSGDWTITVENGVGNIIVNGNLDVLGNITYVDQLEVNDPFIVVAGNNTGTISSGGVIFQKTSNTYAGLRYNTTSGAWQISDSVGLDGAGTYANISIANAASTVAGSNTQIQFNDGGGFGASANLTFNKAINQLTVNGSEALANVGAAISYVGNGVAMYNNTTGAGSTGLYVTGPNTPTDEVISLTRARLYAIIF